MQINGQDIEQAGKLTNIEKRRGKPTSDKLCPFMSDANNEVSCTPICKLYKHNAHGYECPIQELNAISFSLRPK